MKGEKKCLKWTGRKGFFQNWENKENEKKNTWTHNMRSLRLYIVWSLAYVNDAVHLTNVHIAVGISKFTCDLFANVLANIGNPLRVAILVRPIQKWMTNWILPQEIDFILHEIWPNNRLSTAHFRLLFQIDFFDSQHARITLFQFNNVKCIYNGWTQKNPNNKRLKINHIVVKT